MTSKYLEKCHDFLYQKMLRNWAKYGINTESGLCSESLTKDWQNNPVGRIRLLTQCRQLYTFSHAYLNTQDEKWLSTATTLYQAILNHFIIEIADDVDVKIRWRFSLDEALQPLDDTTDAYAMAFILLSFSFYYQASDDESILYYIKQTDLFLKKYMSAPAGGFYEAYPVDLTVLRRQNPHMHLLEGYIAAYNATNDSIYKEQILSILQLAKQHFYDANSRSLLEFFDNNWQPDANTGSQTEPGHHFEWVWLLHQAYKIEPDSDYLSIATQLWNKACEFGLDPQGGIYNQIDASSGMALDQEKRIWPITEYLKATCWQLENTPTKMNLIEKILEFTFSHYLLEDGGWNEYLDKHNQPKNYPLPGTTSYHIFLGLTEVIKWQQSLAQKTL